ncbi:MAG TPA: 4a-hydroxytetrahydrobiopterin dehydratase [Micromonosporaceae bacterium]
MATVLSSDRLSEALAGLPGWSGDSSGIGRSVSAPTFRAAIDLVDAVADAAEAADHHPDIDIRWRTVTFRLSTHSAGGVTEKDVALAHDIDRLAQAHDAT